MIRHIFTNTVCGRGRSAGVFVLTAIVLAAAAAPSAPAKDAVDVSVLENSRNRIVVQYALRDFAQDSETIAGKRYTRITLGDESPFKIAGAPELPNVCRSLVIWDDAAVTVSVLDSSFYEISDIDIVPSKGIIYRTEDPDDVPYTFGDVYDSDAFFPGELATLREPYILRDLRGVVLVVNPFQYNPVTRTLRVYTEMTVEVVPVGPALINALRRPVQPRKPSLAFQQIYQHHFINYESDTRYNPLDEEGEMLIICYDAWLTNIQPFVDHKNSIGIATTAVGVSTIGNNANSIKSYIQNEYGRTNLAFVLLVGDGAEVDTPWASGGSADPTYALVAGGDHYPDIMVGRFSAQNAAQVDTQVLRTIEYELMPATQQDWFKRGTGIGSAEGAGQGDDGESDKQHIENIRTDLLGYGYTLVDRIYDPGATAAQVTNAVNNGRGIINYCGHGSRTSWGTTGFSNYHVNALVNDNMLPFIISVACVNGQFDGYTCFAETWLRATNGSEPTGAIGMYASSINQSWAPPMCAQDEANDLLVAEAYMSFGALCFAGSCQMMDEYGYAGREMFDTWHVFGDPSVRVYGEVSPPDRFVPDNAYAEPGKGMVLDGGVEKLAQQDDDFWTQLAEVQFVTISLESVLVAETTVAADAYASGQVTVVMKATPPRPDPAQYRVRAWDYSGGDWVTLDDGQMPADGSPLLLALDLPGDVNDFIEPGTRRMRVDVQNITDRVAAGMLVHGIDLIQWDLTP